jgi:hypothetical protein
MRAVSGGIERIAAHFSSHAVEASHAYFLFTAAHCSPVLYIKSPLRSTRKKGNGELSGKRAG